MYNSITNLRQNGSKGNFYIKEIPLNNTSGFEGRVKYLYSEDLNLTVPFLTISVFNSEIGTNEHLIIKERLHCKQTRSLHSYNSIIRFIIKSFYQEEIESIKYRPKSF